jgi:hypothetical protein
MPEDDDNDSTDNETNLSDLSISVMQEAGWILEYELTDEICAPLLPKPNPLVSAIRRASALLFVQVGETLHKRYAGPPLCASWDELVCHRDSLAHYVMAFRGEWTAARMRQFAEEHRVSTRERRREALWDLLRWLDEQEDIPANSGVAWYSGKFFRSDSAERIAAMCNGVLVASSVPSSVTPSIVVKQGELLMAQLEAARQQFRAR